MQNDRVDSAWLMTLAAAGVLFVGVAGSMRRAARHGASWQARVEAHWREIAERIGARLETSPSASLSPRRLTMVLEVDDVAGVAEVNVPVDPSAPSHTQARARFVLGRGPSFRMWERGVADLPGLEHEVLGDRALVRRVRVETDHPAATAAIFSSAASAHASAFRRRIALRSDGRTIELVWDGVESDGDVLASALRLVAELAGSGTALLRELAAIDGATYVPATDGGPLVRVRREHAEIELRAEPSATGLSYAARATSHRSAPDFRVRIAADGSVDGVIPTGVIDPQLAPPLSRVGASTLEQRGETLELAWDAPPSREQADAAVRLLAAMTSTRGRHGAFR